MQADVVETGPVERRLRVEVPTARVDAAFETVYRQMGRSARIPGFRPGRAPRSVLERYFGERARREVLEQLVRDTLPEAVSRYSLAVLGEPQLQPEGEPREGGPFVYQATVEIRPTIELRSVRGLQVVRPRLPQPEEDPVERELEELQATHAQLVSEPEGTRSARGHVAVIDYEATRDGKPIPGAGGREQTLELGSGRAIPGFEEQLEGLGVGEVREFDLDLPESSQGAGSGPGPAHFRVTLVELKQRLLPELDDEFAKDVSESNTLDELRASLRARLAEQRAAAERRLLRGAVLRALAEANPFPLPPSSVERQLASRLARAIEELRGRIPDAELRRLVEGWREEWRPAAEIDARVAFLVPEVARAEGIAIEDEALDQELRRIAQARGESFSRTRRSYRERGLLEVVRAGLLEQRVVEFLLAEATLADA